jgi:5,5'-dehydrodivanillate O-demethylase
MHDDFTLYRGESGQAHVLAFRCAHRATQLSTGWVEGDGLRCFYHGWKYGPDGQCTEQPAEPEPFCQRIRIPTYPVYEYLGLIFAYFGVGDPPPPPHYPEFEHGVEVDAATAYVPYNFFQNMENSVDTVHVAFVHRESTFHEGGRQSEFYEQKKDSQMGALQGVASGCDGEETEYGFIFRDDFEGGAVRISHFEIPNILHIKGGPIDAESGWRDFVAWKVPIDDVSYRNFNLNVAFVTGEAAERYRAHPMHPSTYRDSNRARQIQEIGNEILAGTKRLHADDVGSLASNVNLQDYVAQHGQGIIADRQHEHPAASDKVVMLLRQLWSREMLKLARGEPLKEWRWPGYLETTSGAS